MDDEERSRNGKVPYKQLDDDDELLDMGDLGHGPEISLHNLPANQNCQPQNVYEVNGPTPKEPSAPKTPQQEYDVYRQDSYGYDQLPPPYSPREGYATSQNYREGPHQERLIANSGSPYPVWQSFPEHGYAIPPNRNRDDLTVVVQPSIVVGRQQSPENFPSDYLGFSICTLVLCNICLGVMALLASIECRKATIEGNLQLAIHASRRARRLATLSSAVGIITLVLVTVPNIIRFTTLESNLKDYQHGT